jgi:hypothetical protein
MGAAIDTASAGGRAMSLEDGNMNARNVIGAAALGFFVALPLVGLFSASRAGTEDTINAYSPWVGRGQMIQTGPESASFVGSFSGMIFVEKQQELLNGGNMVCPGIFHIDLTTGKQSGQGRCAITNADGERVFTEWTCTGTFSAGCEGELKFTGGTGPFEGISGGGPFKARAALHETFLTTVGNIVGNASTGITIWKDVRYVLP